MTYFNNDGASYNIEDAFSIVNKMNMGGMSSNSTSSSSKASCKISVCFFLPDELISDLANLSFL